MPLATDIQGGRHRNEYQRCLCHPPRVSYWSCHRLATEDPTTRSHCQPQPSCDFRSCRWRFVRMDTNQRRCGELAQSFLTIEQLFTAEMRCLGFRRHYVFHRYLLYGLCFRCRAARYRHSWDYFCTVCRAEIQCLISVFIIISLCRGFCWRELRFQYGKTSASSSETAAGGAVE